MIKLVTGYVPIAGHPRTAAEYGALGDKLATVRAPLKAFYTEQKNCWLERFLWEQTGVTHSTGDNPVKNSLAYHIANHQKVEWLYGASVLDKESTHFAWIDYGIMHVPGITATVIEDFLRRAKDEKAIAVPGCWPKSATIDDANPCWRFCGGVFVVPRKLVKPLYKAYLDTAKRRIWKTKNVTWEVNTMAHMEQRCPDIPLWWYQADHNETLFTGYKKALVI